jgi:hypothetical protein
MMARIGVVLVVLALIGPIAGCTPAPPTGGEDRMTFAPGLTQLSDGSAQAVGTLEYRDLEGGMWVIVGGTEPAGDAGGTVAVIANAQDLGSKLEMLKGMRVIAKGVKLDGASIRMAGPEITVTSIDEFSGTGSSAP